MDEHCAFYGHYYHYGDGPGPGMMTDVMVGLAAPYDYDTPVGGMEDLVCQLVALSAQNYDVGDCADNTPCKGECKLDFLFQVDYGDHRWKNITHKRKWLDGGAIQEANLTLLPDIVPDGSGNASVTLTLGDYIFGCGEWLEIEFQLVDSAGVPVAAPVLPPGRVNKFRVNMGCKFCPGVMSDSDPKMEQRNRLVAVLANIYPSKMTRTDIEGWDPEWHWCVYIETPVGQISFHIHDSQWEWFHRVPVVDDNHNPWDGHDDDVKWWRVSTLAENPEVEPL